MKAAANVAQEEKRQQDVLRLICKAKESERAAQMLREQGEQLIARTTDECAYARQRVESTLSNKMRETQDAKTRLEKSIADSERSILATQQSNQMTRSHLLSHQEPFEIASARKLLRDGRPQREKIADPVTTALDKEVSGLKLNFSHLVAQHGSERLSLIQLHQTRKSLEADLSDKCAALEIDTKCKHTQVFTPSLTLKSGPGNTARTFPPT